jgi:hypothetical protein
MPHRILPILDSIVMSIFTWSIVLASFNAFSILAGLFASLWWISKIKRDIEKNHDGDVSEWVKWIVKKK